MGKKKSKKKTLPSTAAEFRTAVLKRMKKQATKNKKGKEVTTYKPASKKVRKKNKNYKTVSKYNKYYQMTNCKVLKKMDGTPETDLEVYNQLLEVDKEVDTMIADLQNLTKQGDSNLATVKAGINSLMKNELNEVTFNVGGTAPLYEMIYHINENLNAHIKESSFTSFEQEFTKAVKKHAQIEADYFKEYTRQVYKVMTNNLQTAETNYNKNIDEKMSTLSQNGFKIPQDGAWTSRFTLNWDYELPKAQRTSYTLLRNNPYGEKVFNRNNNKKNYAVIRDKAKQLSGTPGSYFKKAKSSSSSKSSSNEWKDGTWD